MQKEVKDLKKDLALQREKEEIFSSLKTHMAKKLQEKEVVVAELKGQLEALKNQEREPARATQKILSLSTINLSTKSIRCWKREYLSRERI